MAVESKKFAASIDEWVQASEQRMLAVFHESTQRVASLANNGVPVDTGFARGSVRASTEAMPSIDPNAKGGSVSAEAMSAVTLVIAGSRLGQTVFIGWTASYILPLEYGHSQQAPSGFVRLAAAQWQVTVDRVTQEAKGRAGRS
jgi:hypothetical protein